MSSVDAEQTNAKNQLVNDNYVTKIFGVIWDKKRVKIGVVISGEETQVTKRGILQKVRSGCKINLKEYD